MYWLRKMRTKMSIPSANQRKNEGMRTRYGRIRERLYLQDSFCKYIKTEIERDISSADAVHKLVNDRLSRKDFTEIRSRADESKELYQNISTYLNEIRTLKE